MEEQKRVYRKLSTGFLVIAFGMFWVLVDLKTKTGIDILPDLFGFLLILIGSMYFFSCRSLFNNVLKFIVVALPFIVLAVLVGNLAGLFMPALAKNNILCGLFYGIEELLWFAIIGMGWKVSDIYNLSVKKYWKIAFIFQILSIFSIVVERTVSFVLYSVGLGASKPAMLIACFVIILAGIFYTIYFLACVLHTRQELEDLTGDMLYY